MKPEFYVGEKVKATQSKLAERTGAVTKVHDFGDNVWGFSILWDEGTESHGTYSGLRRVYGIVRVPTVSNSEFSDTWNFGAE